MWTVIKKELRGYFNSAIALIFLAAFLAVVMYTFFWHEKFFARGLADLRPLFEWMPVLLIILVSALAMRLWADERRAGTLEILLTLPVPRWQLVVGKFIAGMALIAIALGLTLGIPLTVAQMGNLDLGPVIGGYLAALLLSAAYLSIGMCVSAATDNQIIAFVGTAFACGVAYAIGDLGGALGRFLGTGVRFESVARGVLDLRDLAYYGTIVAVGIAANVLLLQRVTWGRGPSGRPRRLGALLALVLVVANAIAFDVWLAPIKRVRIDLTQEGTFSLSESTERLLANLDEQLVIRGYFSEKTHPQLVSYTQQIRDLLEEYRLAGRGKVRVEIIDPVDSLQAKADAKERYSIESIPMPHVTATEQTVLNVYFAIAVEFGDQHGVVAPQDLMKWELDEHQAVKIHVGNVEYALTRTIKKTMAEFSSLDTLFASAPGKVQLTAYVTPKVLPENWKDAPAKLQKVVDELTKQAGGKLSYTTVEPKTEAEMRDLFQKFRIQPYQDLFTGTVIYFHLLAQVGDRIVQITPPQSLGDQELKDTIVESLKRAAPGFTRVVGMWSPPAPPPMPMMEGMPPQQMPPPQTFELLQRQLSGNYEVRDVSLATPIPADIDVLVLAGPANLDAKAVEHIDQFVMRGGALVALAGRFRLAPAEDISVELVTTGLEAMFAKWGITVTGEMVLDPKCESINKPTVKRLPNGMMVRDFEKIPYPFFARLEGEQLAPSSLITSGLTGSVMHFASPVKAETKVGEDTHSVDVLLTTSTDAWTTASTNVRDDQEKFPGFGFERPPADKTASQVVAVAVVGGVASSVAAADAKPDPAQAAQQANEPRKLTHSPPDTRIVVFGSSAFVSDDILRFSQQAKHKLALSNVELVHNAVDWALADTDLLAIRSRNAAAGALTIDPDSTGTWRTANVVIAFVALLLLTGFAWLRRRAVQPITEASP